MNSEVDEINRSRKIFEQQVIQTENHTNGLLPNDISDQSVVNFRQKRSQVMETTDSLKELFRAQKPKLARRKKKKAVPSRPKKKITKKKPMPRHQKIGSAKKIKQSFKEIEELIWELFTTNPLEKKYEIAPSIVKRRLLRLFHLRHFGYSKHQISFNQMLKDFSEKCRKRDEEFLKFVVKNAVKNLYKTKANPEELKKGRITKTKLKYNSEIERDYLAPFACENDVSLDRLKLFPTSEQKTEGCFKLNKKFLRLLKKNKEYCKLLAESIVKRKQNYKHEIEKKTERYLQNIKQRFGKEDVDIMNLEKYLAENEKAKSPWTFKEAFEAFDFIIRFLQE